MGILYCWQTLPPARLRELATSPRIATTLSRLISFCTAALAWSCLDSSSSVISLIFLPKTPPALLACSIASSSPLCELCPKVAVPPVIEAYSPRRISLPEPPEPSFLQELREMQQRRVIMRSRQRIECSCWNWAEYRANLARRPAYPGGAKFGFGNGRSPWANLLITG